MRYAWVLGASLLVAGSTSPVLAPPRSTAADTAFAWTMQSRVHSKASTCVRASPAASASCFAVHQCCDKGTLVGGPTPDPADLGVPNPPTIFWQVQFDVGSSGWVWQPYLVLDTLFVTPPPAPSPSPPPAPPPAPPPPPPPPAPVVVYLQMSPSSMHLKPGEETQVSGFPYDNAHHATGDTVQWTVVDTARARVLAPYPVSSFAIVTAQQPGTTFVRANVGTVLGQIQLVVDPAPVRPPPPPPPPPVFGISDEHWIQLTQCPLIVATTCIRGPVPVFSHIDGHTILNVTITATFTP